MDNWEVHISTVICDMGGSEKGEKVWEIPKDVDIIPAVSSRDWNIVEIRLGVVEYMR